MSGDLLPGLLLENHPRPRALVKVDHPAAPDANAAEASSNRLVDGDQARGDVDSIAAEMP